MVIPSYARDVAFASANYVVALYCYQDYTRPSNGVQMHDYMCTFKVTDRKSADISDGETDLQPVDGKSFTPYTLDTNVVSVTGVNPGNLKVGQGFAWYGKNAQLFGQVIPGTLAFVSPSHTVTLTCTQYYKRPSTGELRSDYMCEVRLTQ